MRVDILALNGVFDTGLAALLDAFATANELAQMQGLTTVRFEVTLVGVRSRVRTGQGLAAPVQPAKGRPAPDWLVVPAIAEKMPGLVSAKDFTAEDGERVAIVEFDTEAHLLAWRDHVEHRRAQAQGRESFYTAYSIQICRVERSSAFDHAAGTWEQRPARW